MFVSHGQCDLRGLRLPTVTVTVTVISAEREGGRVLIAHLRPDSNRNEAEADLGWDVMGWDAWLL